VATSPIIQNISMRRKFYLIKHFLIVVVKNYTNKKYKRKKTIVIAQNSKHFDMMIRFCSRFGISTSELTGLWF
jgi:hypothetical protein